MKNLTIYATSLANENPGQTGYKFHMADPHPDIELSRRSFITGFAVPVAITVPDHWEIAETKDDEKFLFNGKTPMILVMNNGGLISFPAFSTYEEAKTHGAIVPIKFMIGAVASN